VIGIALAVLALGYGPAYERTHGMSWTAALLGIWTIIAPWAVAGNAAVTKTEVSNIITGAVAILLALATTAMGWRTARADVS